MVTDRLSHRMAMEFRSAMSPSFYVHGVDDGCRGSQPRWMGSGSRDTRPDVRIGVMSGSFVFGLWTQLSAWVVDRFQPRSCQRCTMTALGSKLSLRDDSHAVRVRMATPSGTITYNFWQVTHHGWQHTTCRTAHRWVTFGGDDDLAPQVFLTLQA